MAGCRWGVIRAMMAAATLLSPPFGCGTSPPCGRGAREARDRAYANDPVAGLPQTSEDRMTAKHRPNDQSRGVVERAASLGFTEPLAGTLLGINDKTLRRY